MRRLVIPLLAVLLFAVPFSPSARATEAGTVVVAGTVELGTDSATFRSSTCRQVWAPPTPSPLEVGDLCGLYLSGTRSAVSGQFGPMNFFTHPWCSVSLAFPVPVLEVGTFAGTGTATCGSRSGPATFTIVTSPNLATGLILYQGTLQYLVS